MISIIINVCTNILRKNVFRLRDRVLVCLIEKVMFQNRMQLHNDHSRAEETKYFFFCSFEKSSPVEDPVVHKNYRVSHMKVNFIHNFENIDHIRKGFIASAIFKPSLSLFKSNILWFFVVLNPIIGRSQTPFFLWIVLAFSG